MHKLTIPILLHIGILLSSTYLFSNSVVALTETSKTSNIAFSIPVGIHPTGIAVNPNNNKIYVANAGSDSISVIDGLSTRLLNKITVGDNPIDIEVNPSNNKVYVA